MPSGRLPSPKSKWYLPPETYKSVQHFCLSYMEMQAELVELQKQIDTIGLIRGQHLDGMPHGTDISNPTLRQAILREDLERRRDRTRNKIKLIENTVDKVAFTGRRQLLWAVTNRYMTYERLKGLHGVPYGKNQFGRMKQEVYWRIAQEL